MTSGQPEPVDRPGRARPRRSPAPSRRATAAVVPYARKTHRSTRRRQQRPGDAESGQRRGAEVADDRRVGEQEQRLGDQGAERGDGEPEDLPVLRPGGRSRRGESPGRSRRPDVGHTGPHRRHGPNLSPVHRGWTANGAPAGGPVGSPGAPSTGLSTGSITLGPLGPHLRAGRRPQVVHRRIRPDASARRRPSVAAVGRRGFCPTSLRVDMHGSGRTVGRTSRGRGRR